MKRHITFLRFLAIAGFVSGSLNSVVFARAVDDEDAAIDKVVTDFIKFDIGQIRDPFTVEQIKARFNALRSDDAVPALVRGLNASTRMRASCPITALSGKLRGIVTASKNPEVGTFVLQNLERNDAGPYTAVVNAVFGAAESQVTRTMGNGFSEQRFRQRAAEDMQRLAYMPGYKLTDLALRESGETPNADGSGDSHRSAQRKGVVSRPAATRSSTGSSSKPAGTPTESGSPAPSGDLGKLGTDELITRLQDRSVEAKVLAELARRAGAGDEQKVSDQAEAIIRSLKDGDDVARESAARLLGIVRSQRGIPQLIDALDDPNAKVRSAAATSLTRITRQLFGPSDDATPDDRRLAIARWRDWWGRQGKGGERASLSLQR